MRGPHVDVTFTVYRDDASVPGRAIVPREAGGWWHFDPVEGGYAGRLVIHVAYHLLERWPIPKLAAKLGTKKTGCAQLDAAILHATDNT